MFCLQILLSGVMEDGFLLKVKNKNGIFINAIMFFLLFFTGCKVTVFEKSQFQDFHPKKWTLMIYMCGDNNLALNVLDDINEMEAGFGNLKDVNIIVLSDVSSGYISDEFSGTRLYEIKYDNEGLNYRLVSEELSCSYLGLNKYVKNNINVADPYVLQKFIEYTARVYPASHYGLVIWGHGNGWRSSSIEEVSLKSENRAIAFDESSKQFMSISNFRNAIKNNEEINNFDFIGFDCCFGSEIEVLYELKDCSNYFAGVEGLEGNDGWNYEELFSIWSSERDESGIELCHSFELMSKKSGMNEYGSYNLNKIELVFTYFEDYFSQVVQLEDTDELSYDELKETLKMRFVPGTYSDVYLDVYELSKYISDKHEERILQDKFNLFNEALLSCKNTFKDSSLDAFNVGVFFCSLDVDGNPIGVFPQKYIHGDNTSDQSLFVKKSKWYVPSKYGNTSFLDKIFNL